jgi:hypothetical protein
MPSARIRYAGEAAFLLLVALGLGLVGFEPIVIVVVMFVAAVMVALFERAAREATRSAVAAEVKRIDVAPATVVEGPAPAAESQPVAEPEPEPSVDERSARAILASAPPPQPPEAPKAKWKARRRVVRRPQRPGTAPPPPEPEPELEPLVTSPPREWNLWEVQRAVRDAQNEERREEWSALLIHLREFANPDGDLPVEFDGLVRESFGAVLVVGQREPAVAP